MCELKDEKENKMRLNEFAEDVHQIAAEHGLSVHSLQKYIVLCPLELKMMEEYREEEERKEYHENNAPHGISFELEKLILRSLDNRWYGGSKLKSIWKKRIINRSRQCCHGRKEIQNEIYSIMEWRER